VLPLDIFLLVDLDERDFPSGLFFDGFGSDLEDGFGPGVEDGFGVDFEVGFGVGFGVGFLVGFWVDLDLF